MIFDITIKITRGDITAATKVSATAEHAAEIRPTIDEALEALEYATRGTETMPVNNYVDEYDNAPEMAVSAQYKPMPGQSSGFIPATDKQVLILKRMGYTDKEIKKMSKMDAWNLINDTMPKN